MNTRALPPKPRCASGMAASFLGERVGGRAGVAADVATAHVRPHRRSQACRRGRAAYYTMRAPSDLSGPSRRADQLHEGGHRPACPPRSVSDNAEISGRQLVVQAIYQSAVRREAARRGGAVSESI